MGVVDVLVSEHCAALILILRRLPSWVEHLGGNSQIRRGVAMTVETPPHGQRCRLSYQRHGGDIPVARAAADAFGDVDRVIEVDVIRQAVDPVPVDRPPPRQTFADGREQRRLGVKLRMAGHAGVRRGDAGDGGSFDPGVAIPAINPETASMVLVTEWHWLMERQRAVGHVFGTCDPEAKTDRQERHYNNRNQNGSGNRVGIRPKQVRHLPLSLPTVAQQEKQAKLAAQIFYQWANATLRVWFRQGTITQIVATVGSKKARLGRNSDTGPVARFNSQTS